MRFLQAPARVSDGQEVGVGHLKRILDMWLDTKGKGQKSRNERGALVLFLLGSGGGSEETFGELSQSLQQSYNILPSMNGQFSIAKDLATCHLL